MHYQADLLSAIAARLLAIPITHPLRVAIDGVDTAGKTTLADELALVLSASNRTILRATIDRFHHPRALRYRLGSDSPEGCYHDTFNLPLLRQVLLDPLGPGGSRIVETARFDVLADQPVQGQPVQVSPDAILLFDGVFLQRPELADAWDFVIFVKVSFETVLARAVLRDRQVIGPPDAIIKRYQTRYIPAQRHYLSTCQPESRADWVIENDD